MYEEIRKAELDELVAKLNAETAKIAWSELQTFFASGMTVYVSHKLDLIKVACELAEDNRDQVEDWMGQGLVANVSDEQASAWLESDILVWATVIHPWVLVQPVVD
ncbi:MAG: DUF2288 domain-containing protein [Gammaproteobacteria bacterium]